MYNLKVVIQNEQKRDVHVIDVEVKDISTVLSKIKTCIQSLFSKSDLTAREIWKSEDEVHLFVDQAISGYKAELLNLLFSNHVLYENFEIKVIEDTDEVIDGYSKTYLLNNEWVSVNLSHEAGLNNPEFVKEVCKHQKLSIAYCADEADLLNKVRSLFGAFIEYNK